MANSRPGDPHSSPSHVQKNSTIVVAEHNLEMFKLYQALSPIAGCIVVGTASRASSVLRLISEEKPDCLVADFNLEGRRDGLDLIMEAKLLRPDLFTLLITAWNVEAIATKIEQAKPDVVLQKPFMAHSFLNAIASRFPAD